MRYGHGGGSRGPRAYIRAFLRSYVWFRVCFYIGGTESSIIKDDSGILYENVLGSNKSLCYVMICWRASWVWDAVHTWTVRVNSRSCHSSMSKRQHGLSCPLGPGYTPRCPERSNIPNPIENRVSSNQGATDGITLISWKAGRSLVRDATVIDTPASSYTVYRISRSVRSRGCYRCGQKHTENMIPFYKNILIPLALETRAWISFRTFVATLH